MSQEEMMEMLFNKWQSLMKESEVIERGTEEHTRVMGDLIKVQEMIVKAVDYYSYPDVIEKEKRNDKYEFINKLWMNILETSKVILPPLTYIWCMNQILTYEKEGIITNSVFRNLFGQIKLFQK